MLSWINKHKVRILLNILAWGFLLDATYTNGLAYHPQPGMKDDFTLHVILYNTLFILASSLNTMWLMPKYFVRRKYIVYIPALALLILTFSAIASRYNAWLMQYFKGVDEMNFCSISIGIKTERITWIEYWFSVIPSICITLFIFSIGYLTQQYFKIKKQQEAIDKKQLESELNLLKSQINPHFLFNVLNSIYALALKKSDYAPEIVLKLSDIMRYMLYETKHEKVALDKEIDMIENYIGIEKVRIGNGQHITLAIGGSPDSQVIAPVLLIPFVENAVKHGVDSMSEHAYVHITINVANGELHFSCINNYKEVKVKKIGGIGLENVKKRLELIYPGKHNLNVKNENGIFTVSLNIMLN